MVERYITNKKDFKVKVVIKGCISPSDRKCVEFIREQYNDKDELIDSSMYQFFMSESELITLANILLLMK